MFWNGAHRAQGWQSTFPSFAFCGKKKFILFSYFANDTCCSRSYGKSWRTKFILVKSLAFQFLISVCTFVFFFFLFFIFCGGVWGMTASLPVTEVFLCISWFSLLFYLLSTLTKKRMLQTGEEKNYYRVYFHCEWLRDIFLTWCVYSDNKCWFGRIRVS